MTLKCPQCASSTSVRWHPITEAITEHFTFKERRDTTSVCNKCYMKWYMESHMVSWRHIKGGCSPWGSCVRPQNYDQLKEHEKLHRYSKLNRK